MVFELVDDTCVASDLAVPATTLRVGVEGTYVSELAGEDRGVLGCGYEVVALLADVGVGARLSGQVP